MSITSRLALGSILAATIVACGGQPQVSTPAGGAPAPSQSISINDGESLVRAMHAKYNGQWPRALTYTQTTTLLGSSGTSNDQLWYVAILAPGRQRIDYVNPSLANGALVRADSTYQFVNGRQAGATEGWNDLLVLTQDVYNQSPDVTVSILRRQGFQLSRLQSKTFDGRSAYVVGASSSNDSTSRQFWIERDRLVLVRIREKRGDNFVDTRLGDFIKAGEGFVARQTYQFANGVPRLHQQIAGLRTDTPLAPDLFEPKLFGSVKHWSKP
jgi:hypothetical protein